MNRKRSTKFGMALAAVLGLGGLAPSIGRAVQLADGTVSFVQPSRLVAAATNRSNTLAARATYYFTIEVPEDSGEPLQRVVINQRDSATAPDGYCLILRLVLRLRGQRAIAAQIYRWVKPSLIEKRKPSPSRSIHPCLQGRQ